MLRYLLIIFLRLQILLSRKWHVKHHWPFLRLYFGLPQLVLLLNPLKIVVNENFIYRRCRLNWWINRLLRTLLRYSLYLNVIPNWLHPWLFSILLWHHSAQNGYLLISTLLTLSPLFIMLLLINQSTSAAQSRGPQSIQNLVICWQAKSVKVPCTTSMVGRCDTGYSQVATTADYKMHRINLRRRWFMVMRFAIVKILRINWW